MNIRSKLALGLSVSTALLSTAFRQAWPLAVWALTFLPLAWILLLKRWRMAGIYLLLGCISHLDHVSALDPLMLRCPWPVLLFLIILQYLLPGITIGYLIVQNTSISEYLNGLSRMHVPAGITLATSVIFRFIPTIGAENTGIRQAMRMRGLGGLKALRHPLQHLNYRLTPLLLSTSRIGDELSMASLCRGLSTSRKRTSYAHDELCLFDWLVISLSALLLLLWLASLFHAASQ